MPAFIILGIFIIGFAVAVSYLTFGLYYDTTLYLYLKKKKTARFTELYSLSAKGALLTRVWRYIYDSNDMNDKTIKECKMHLRKYLKNGSIGILLVVLSFAMAYALL